MGMAASQARYLGLTARKTNVEYEGQQVNQARTALAMQAANTFSELLKLEVPTAPSTQDFTKLQYSYQDGLVTETITEMSSLQNDPDYNYMVTHHHYSDVFTGIRSMKTNPQVTFGTKAAKSALPSSNVTYDEGSDTFYVNGVALTQYDPNVESQKELYSQIVHDYPDFVKSDISNIFTFTGADGKMYFASRTDLKYAAEGSIDLAQYTVKENVPSYVGNCSVLPYDTLDTDQKAAIEQIRKDFPTQGIASTQDVYSWEFQGTRYYATLEDLKKTSESGKDKTKPIENQSKLVQYAAMDISTKIELKQKALIDLDSSGRPQTIRYEDSSATYPVNTETITDEKAYQDAMNQYNYKMQVYEKRIADINAKTEKIQEQDRTLELRLRQLDTEQEALQTEMEAVKKVIDKNIESTFKTFE